MVLVVLWILGVINTLYNKSQYVVIKFLGYRKWNCSCFMGFLGVFDFLLLDRFALVTSRCKTY